MERTKEEVEKTRLVCCATPPTKIAKKTGSRCTRIYRRALRRDNLSTTQERSFSYPQWGRTVNNKQETRKRLFGVRLFKKKSKKESLGSIEWRLYCRLVQEKSTKNKKSKAAPRSSLLSGPHVAKRIQGHVEQALVYGNSEPQDHEGRQFPKARQQSQPPQGGYRLYWRYKQLCRYFLPFIGLLQNLFKEVVAE